MLQKERRCIKSWLLKTEGGGGLEKCLQESHFSWYLLQIWNINSWDMTLSTHYFSGLLQDWFHVFYMKLKKKSVWYNFYQGTSVSITFYIFEHYQLWMMDSKAQRVFFPKTPKLCVWHTEVRRCYHFKLVSHFQLWFPIWGVLVNRLTHPCWIKAFIYFIFLKKKKFDWPQTFE